MTTMAITVNEMLDTLEDEDYTAAVRYIEFLSSTRKESKKKSSVKALKEIQSMFVSDKGWDSEEDMISDMAAFRRERQCL